MRIVIVIRGGMLASVLADAGGVDVELIDLDGATGGDPEVYADYEQAQTDLKSGKLKEVFP